MESTVHLDMEAVNVCNFVHVKQHDSEKHNNENSSLGATACMEPMKLAELYKSICVSLISTVGPVYVTVKSIR